MRQSDLWRDLRKQFEDLPEQNDDVDARWRTPLGGGRTRWNLSVPKGFGGHDLLPLILKAAAAMNNSQSVDSEDAWMERLREMGFGKRYESWVETNEDGSFTSFEGGRIPRLRRACVELCSQLEIATLRVDLREPTPEPVHENRAAVEAYINDIERESGKKISKADVWRAAGYKARRECERWERGELKAGSSVDRNVRRVLRERPHLKD